MNKPLNSILDEITGALKGKGEVNVDVFAHPEKYSVCLPIEKVVADSKVEREGIEFYKRKIKNNEKIDPLIVVKHPKKDLYAVLDGHHRYYAYVELGKKQINCALAGNFSSIIFSLTEKGYFQPPSEFTKEIRQPAKQLHKNLKEFLDEFSANSRKQSKQK